ncbi:MAG: type II toxin-antitoxin system mRNA interferase toxin, RelE/StbE family [Thermoplasmata archaeon HGW-Thermoplasmata-1]|nr:MAG: type II toxin-antitoxin system mRNA interferase toxin, RelE/StbE family [Thermoplasmata archaeon HGW-Thermoplasmata-1]
MTLPNDTGSKPIYSLEIKPAADKVFAKIAKKDPSHFDIIQSKIEQIRKTPDRYKPLKHSLKGRQRVHIGHFVLVFRFKNPESVLEILDYTHHDNAY